MTEVRKKMCRAVHQALLPFRFRLRSEQTLPERFDPLTEGVPLRLLLLSLSDKNIHLRTCRDRFPVDLDLFLLRVGQCHFQTALLNQFCPKSLELVLRYFEASMA